MIYTKSGKPIKQPHSKWIQLGIRLSTVPILGEKICHGITGYCNRFKDTTNATKRIEKYAKTYGISRHEIEDCQQTQTESECWEQFESLNDFFIRRRLRLPDIRNDQYEVVSPVDAYTAFNICSNCWIKGSEFTTSQLMLGQQRSSFNLNVFIFRLAPHHYHRCHSPVCGSILAIYTIGEQYNSVDRYLIQSSKNVLTRNVRTIIVIQTRMGIMYLALIGATCVGSIVLTHPSILETLNFKDPIDDDYIRQNPITFDSVYAPKISINEELGYFQFGGSCVVMGCAFDVYNYLSPIGKVVVNHSLLQAETELEVGDSLLDYYS
jgi:phosphatidylserine decarboxylase precursor